MLNFVPLYIDEQEKIREMSEMASSIIREHFDPLIGKDQNDYMISLFQTPTAIADQLRAGYRYYFVQKSGKNIGFVAFYPKGEAMYLSKFYLYKAMRGCGYSRQMLSFVIDESKKEKCSCIELNVNKHNSACKAYDHLGFKIIRSEKNDIGNGFYMDDYVYRYDLS